MANGLDLEIPTLEVNDNHTNDSIMFPRGNNYARGKVIGRKRDADGNSTGGMNDNTILDTHEYCV